MIGHLEMELNSKTTKDRWICFKEDIPEPPLLANGDDTIERPERVK